MCEKCRAPQLFSRASSTHASLSPSPHYTLQEQFCDNSWAAIANYSTLYKLAALEANRTSVQILHEQDPCCFHGCGRHDRIRAYNADVAGSGAAGLFQTAVTTGNVHEVNPRDKVILASLLDKLRIAGALLPDDVRRLPFNTLEEW